MRCVDVGPSAAACHLHGVAGAAGGGDADRRGALGLTRPGRAAADAGGLPRAWAGEVRRSAQVDLLAEVGFCADPPRRRHDVDRSDAWRLLSDTRRFRFCIGRN
jgi:hypothetical protein